MLLKHAQLYNLKQDMRSNPGFDAFLSKRSLGKSLREMFALKRRRLEGR
jgi:hypothetical protein